MADASTSSDYLRDRVAQYRAWYDGRARRSKAWFLSLRVFTLAAAAAVPVALVGTGTPARYVAVVLSLLVVVSVGLEGIIRFREQWENYRYTEQYLDREKFLYLAAAGPYRGLDPDEAFRDFVERVEWAIGAENSTTLATMALTPALRPAK